MKYRCGNCPQVWDRPDLKPVADPDLRIEQDGPIPSGECPECGALCYREEVNVELADGCTLRSGGTKFVSGDWVRLCDKDGNETGLEQWGRTIARGLLQAGYDNLPPLTGAYRRFSRGVFGR